MDNELKKMLLLTQNKGATITTATYNNQTDSLEQLSDLLGTLAAAATADDLSDITTTSIHAKLRRLLLRFSANAFSASVNPGAAAATDVETMITDLANILAGGTGIVTYPIAADIGNGVSLAEAIRAILTSIVGGDDYDAYTNINNTANVSLNAALQNLAAVLGANGANVFNPTIQGAARTDLDAALANLATYISAAGAAYSATVDPGGSARTTIEETLEDLGQVLAGASGITTFPVAQNIGNGISLAEAIRAILTSLVGGDTYTAYTNINNAANTSLNAALQNLATVLGANGANVFNPSIGGAARTDLDAALAALGTALGAEYDGTPDLYDVTVTGYDSSGLSANRDGSISERAEDLADDLDGVQATVLAEGVLKQAINTTQTTQGGSVTVFALDALAKPLKDIRLEFWLDADGAATFTPNWFATREGATSTFVSRLIPAIATIVTPAAAGRYYYEYGDLPQGAQLEFRVAQNGLGAANVALDVVLSYIG